MTQFYAEIEGRRGVASRLGSALSGIRSSTRGWDTGVTVRGSVTMDDSNNIVDRFEIWRNGGSHDPSDKQLIATVVGDEVIYRA